MRIVGKSQRHRWTRGDNVGNKALPQTSNVRSDKRHEDGGQEVAIEYAVEKKRQQQLAMADKSFQGWLTERRSGDERRWRETTDVVMAKADNDSREQ